MEKMSIFITFREKDKVAFKVQAETEEQAKIMTNNICGKDMIVDVYRLGEIDKNEFLVLKYDLKTSEELISRIHKIRIQDEEIRKLETELDILERQKYLLDLDNRENEE